MHRQPSRSTTNMDTIDCIVNTNDLDSENDIIKRDYDQRSKSRRDQTSKRSNEISTHRADRHSPPSVTRKRQSSPPANSSSSRSHHHYYPSQRHHRVPTPSPSPPPPPPPPLPSSSSSSRHHRPTRPLVASKRPLSQSKSPHERRPPTHRSRPDLSVERASSGKLATIPSAETPPRTTKSNYKQESADLSFVSEDESTKVHDHRPNGATVAKESSSMPTNNKLHSTPSIPTVPSNSNESLLDMSTIPQECELSLFAKSMLSTTNTSSILSTPVTPSNDTMHTMDLINKYKTMQSVPNTNTQIEALSKEILSIIQKQIEVQKIELECREREIRLRQRELDEREKRLNEKSSETISTNSALSEPLITTKPTVIEEPIQPKLEIVVKQDTQNVSPEESVPKVNVSDKNSSDQPATVTHKPVVDLYADDNEDNPSSSSLSTNTNNSSKKPIISPILAPNDPTIASTLPTDLKVTSSNSFRKVEIQTSSNIDKTTSKGGSSHDLRLTLSKNRSYSDDDEQQQSIKIQSNNDQKQQSNDYQTQRSITSTSIETFVDNSNEKRDERRHRQQQYSSNPNHRAYAHGSTSQQQQSKYNSNQKRYENDDLRSRIFEHRHPKSSRAPHKNNY